MAGSSSEPKTPAIGTPHCRIPMAMPRSAFLKKKMMAWLPAGVTAA